VKISNATHPLNVIAAALQRSGLGGAVLIGNMGAAVHGARVMTDDFDYLVPPFKDLPSRIEALATILGAVVLPPKKLHGTTVLFVNETDMQIDLLVRADGISSYRSLRTRATVYDEIGGTVVASLRDIIRSKRASGRPKDLAVLPELEATLNEIEHEKANLRRR
jgi:hypothetical protein